MIQAGGKLTEEEPEMKKAKRAGMVEPLERPMSASPLPDLPEDLKLKQVHVLGEKTTFV